MDTSEELPPIDERLALPEAGYEIIDGVVTFVVPADPPHAERHHTVSMLIGAHVKADFKVAIDMLTRTSKIDDIAPDVSVFPRAPDPVTGRRQLEQLAFEIVSTESMSHATKKAAKLAGRGVRRVFAIDLVRGRLVEWSRDLESWSVRDVRGHLEDPVLAAPLSVSALLGVISADDEVARALLAKHNPILEASHDRARAEALADAAGRARAEAVIAVLASRGLIPTEAQRAAILAERDPARLDDWLARVATCATIGDLT